MESYKTKTKSRDTITISANVGREKIIKDQIVSCKEYVFGTQVYLKNNAHYLLQESIKELRTILNADHFYVLDKYTLINLRFVEAIFPRTILMKNGEEYKVDPDCKKNLFKRLIKYFSVEI